MLKILDYGLGNVSAFLNAYKLLNIPAEPAKNKDDLLNASHIIIPGVGSFDHAMSLINNSYMRESLNKIALDAEIPIMGVCVGMQILCNSSEEGVSDGLGWIPGRVKKIDIPNNSLPLPHMGWNDISDEDNCVLLKDINNPKFYFLHSYYFEPLEKSSVDASFNYYSDMPCIVRKSNIFGVQFHPEKSHRFGIQFLKNFANISIKE